MNISEALTSHLSVAAMKWFHSWQRAASPAVVLGCCSVSLRAPRSWKPGEIRHYPLIMSYVLAHLVTIRHVIYYGVFPETWCGSFSEAFHTQVGDNIPSQEFAVERLTQLPALLRVALHLIAKSKFRCEQCRGELLNAKEQIQPPVQGEPNHRPK